MLCDRMSCISSLYGVFSHISSKHMMGGCRIVSTSSPCGPFREGRKNEPEMGVTETEAGQQYQEQHCRAGGNLQPCNEAMDIPGADEALLWIRCDPRLIPDLIAGE
ncbi:hypothetical protein F2P79_021764 [Pimephales promelas]|nr:hypothetical protein F2P79_021764 [Pimephales promelas]KAG1931253.1 hypothetical protein F2P79_021764 [Pimephales promelas]